MQKIIKTSSELKISFQLMFKHSSRGVIQILYRRTHKDSHNKNMGHKTHVLERERRRERERRKESESIPRERCQECCQLPAIIFYI